MYLFTTLVRGKGFVRGLVPMQHRCEKSEFNVMITYMQMKEINPAVIRSGLREAKETNSSAHYPLCVCWFQIRAAIQINKHNIHRQTQKKSQALAPVIADTIAALNSGHCEDC